MRLRRVASSWDSLRKAVSYNINITSLSQAYSAVSVEKPALCEPCLSKHGPPNKSAQFTCWIQSQFCRVFAVQTAVLSSVQAGQGNVCCTPHAVYIGAHSCRAYFLRHQTQSHVG